MNDLWIYELRMALFGFAGAAVFVLYAVALMYITRKR